MFSEFIDPETANNSLASESYRSICARYGIKPNAAILQQLTGTDMAIASKTHIDASQTFLGSHGVDALCDLLILHQGIKTVSLPANGLVQANIVSLTNAARTHASLESLDLSNNPNLSTPAAREIWEAARMPPGAGSQLVDANVSGTAIPAEWAQRIQRQLDLNRENVELGFDRQPHPRPRDQWLEVRIFLLAERQCAGYVAHFTERTLPLLNGGGASWRVRFSCVVHYDDALGTTATATATTVSQQMQETIRSHVVNCMSPLNYDLPWVIVFFARDGLNQEMQHFVDEFIAPLQLPAAPPLYTKFGVRRQPVRKPHPSVFMMRLPPPCNGADGSSGIGIGADSSGVDYYGGAAHQHLSEFRAEGYTPPPSQAIRYFNASRDPECAAFLRLQTDMLVSLRGVYYAPKDTRTIDVWADAPDAFREGIGRIAARFQFAPEPSAVVASMEAQPKEVEQVYGYLIRKPTTQYASPLLVYGSRGVGRRSVVQAALWHLENDYNEDRELALARMQDAALAAKTQLNMYAAMKAAASSATSLPSEDGGNGGASPAADQQQQQQQGVAVGQPLRIARWDMTGCNSIVQFLLFVLDVFVKENRAIPTSAHNGNLELLMRTAQQAISSYSGTKPIVLVVFDVDLVDTAWATAVNPFGWFPLAFPPTVRIVCSCATESSFLSEMRAKEQQPYDVLVRGGKRASLIKALRVQWERVTGGAAFATAPPPLPLESIIASGSTLQQQQQSKRRQSVTAVGRAFTGLDPAAETDEYHIRPTAPTTTPPTVAASILTKQDSDLFLYIRMFASWIAVEVEDLGTDPIAVIRFVHDRAPQTVTELVQRIIHRLAQKLDGGAVSAADSLEERQTRVFNAVACLACAPTQALTSTEIARVCEQVYSARRYSTLPLLTLMEHYGLITKRFDGCLACAHPVIRQAFEAYVVSGEHMSTWWASSAASAILTSGAAASGSSANGDVSISLGGATGALVASSPEKGSRVYLQQQQQLPDNARSGQAELDACRAAFAVIHHHAVVNCTVGFVRSFSLLPDLLLHSAQPAKLVSLLSDIVLLDAIVRAHAAGCVYVVDAMIRAIQHLSALSHMYTIEGYTRHQFSHNNALGCLARGLRDFLKVRSGNLWQAALALQHDSTLFQQASRSFDRAPYPSLCLRNRTDSESQSLEVHTPSSTSTRSAAAASAASSSSATPAAAAASAGEHRDVSLRHCCLSDPFLSVTCTSGVVTIYETAGGGNVGAGAQRGTILAELCSYDFATLGLGEILGCVISSGLSPTALVVFVDHCAVWRFAELGSAATVSPAAAAAARQRQQQQQQLHHQHHHVQHPRHEISIIENCTASLKHEVFAPGGATFAGVAFVASSSLRSSNKNEEDNIIINDDEMNDDPLTSLASRSHVSKKKNNKQQQQQQQSQDDVAGGERRVVVVDVASAKISSVVNAPVGIFVREAHYIGAGGAVLVVEPQGIVVCRSDGAVLPLRSHHLSQAHSIHSAGHSRDGSFIGAVTGPRALMWHLGGGSASSGHMGNPHMHEETPLHTVHAPAPLLDIVFVPNGAQAALAAEDGTVLLWNSITGLIHHTLRVDTPDPPAYCLFTPNGRIVVRAGCALRMWDLVTLQDMGGVVAHEGVVNYVDTSSSSASLLFSVCDCGTLKIFSTESGFPPLTKLRESNAPTTDLLKFGFVSKKPIRKIAVSSDSSFVAIQVGGKKRQRPAAASSSSAAKTNNESATKPVSSSSSSADDDVLETTLWYVDLDRSPLNNQKNESSAPFVRKLGEQLISSPMFLTQPVSRHAQQQQHQQEQHNTILLYVNARRQLVQHFCETGEARVVGELPRELLDEDYVELYQRADGFKEETAAVGGPNAVTSTTNKNSSNNNNSNSISSSTTKKQPSPSTAVTSAADKKSTLAASGGTVAATSSRSVGIAITSGKTIGGCRIVVYDVPCGRGCGEATLVAQLVGHSDDVIGLDYLPSAIVSASRDRKITIWSMASKAEKATRLFDAPLVAFCRIFEGEYGATSSGLYCVCDRAGALMVVDTAGWKINIVRCLQMPSCVLQVQPLLNTHSLLFLLESNESELYVWDCVDMKPINRVEVTRSSVVTCLTMVSPQFVECNPAETDSLLVFVGTAAGVSKIFQGVKNQVSGKNTSW